MDIITQLKQRNVIWQGVQTPDKRDRINSQINEIDQRLQGFPAYGVFSVDCMLGIGELRLFSHYLRQKQQQGMLVLVAPPSQLNAEFFMQENISLNKLLILSVTKQSDAVWAVEQCLKSGCCSAVIYWGHLTEMIQVRRCMLAAEQQRACLITLHNTANSMLSQPISLKMSLKPTLNGMHIHVYKQKGGAPIPAFNVDLSQRWSDLYDNNTNRFLLSDNTHIHIKKQH